MKRKVVLASTSPRRIDILSKTDLKFEVVAPEYEEEMGLAIAPLDLVKYLAQKKAESVAHKFPGALIIGADTFIVLGDKIFGKPKTPERAEAMLSELSGKVHEVMTGFSVIDTESKKIITKSDISRVFVRPVSYEERLAYIATGEPLDKAAAYAIQGSAEKFIDKVEGDIESIMGLPLNRVLEVLQEFGVNALRLKP